MSPLFTRTVLLRTLVIAILYVLFSTYLMNWSLVINTVLGNYPIDYKFKLLLALLGGMWTAMTHTGLFVLVLTGLLSGLNISLVVERIQSAGGLRNTHIIVGGSSLLGIVGAGCAACGLPILSLLGISASLVSLPFHGMEISYSGLLLLILSLYMLIKQDKNQKVCAVR